MHQCHHWQHPICVASPSAPASAVDIRKRGRSAVRRDTKGVESFRRALVAHLEQNARLSPLPAPTTDILSIQPSVANAVSESQRPTMGERVFQQDQRLHHQAAREGVSTIQIPMRELSLYSYQTGMHSAKRSGRISNVSALRKQNVPSPPKKILVNICIQDSVKFDFSDFVKDATSHGNKT